MAAIAAGAVQLAAGLTRRGLGGQVPIGLSGGLSVIAGVVLAVTSAEAGSLITVTGYALLGGVFFVVSALRLRSTDKDSA